MPLSLPSLAQAEALLQEAQVLNPGPWVSHSRYVAQAAQAIAANHPALHPETAFILGLLHDIGRRAGVTGMRHVLDGYRFLMDRGFADPARICLTHSYPVKDAAFGSDRWDGSTEEYQFVQDYLDSIEYDPYDRLIQLCDSLALPSGFCLMEKRLVDVVLRYGLRENTLEKWKALLVVRDEFDNALGRSIYSLLPGVVENTFGGGLANSVP